MAIKNIEININNGSSYDTLYPKASYANMADSLNIGNTTGNLSNQRISNGLIVQYASYRGDNTTPTTLTRTLNWSIAVNPLCLVISNDDITSAGAQKSIDSSYSVGTTVYNFPQESFIVFMPVNKSNPSSTLAIQFTSETKTSNGRYAIIICGISFTSLKATLTFRYLSGTPSTLSQADFMNFTDTYNYCILGKLIN